MKKMKVKERPALPAAWRELRWPALPAASRKMIEKNSVRGESCGGNN